MATTCDDTSSITSSRIMPPGPHPTPAHTVAGDLPNNDFIIKKIEGLDVTTEAADLSKQGNYSSVSLFLGAGKRA